MSRRGLSRLLVALGVILVGLGLRQFGYQLGLRFEIVKYGGSVLWGAMVFLLVGSLTGVRRPAVVAALALLLAVVVEFSRLYHTPEMDAFRLTLAGRLLLGRVFSLWNILSYAIGISVAAAMEALVIRVRGSAA